MVPVCEESTILPLLTEDVGPFRVETSFGAPSEMSLGAKATSRFEGLAANSDASLRAQSLGRVVAGNHRVTESSGADPGLPDGRDKERFGETQRFFNCVTPSTGRGTTLIQSAVSHLSTVPRGNDHSLSKCSSEVVGMESGVAGSASIVRKTIC